MPYPTAKCNTLLPNWQACRVPYSKHAGIEHEFSTRPRHKTHIARNDVFLVCGWPNWMATVIAPRDASVIRARAADNEVCSNCFRRYLFEETRDTFMAGALRSGGKITRLRRAN